MKKPVVLGSLALAAALSPAYAGTVYIPFATQQTLAGVPVRTEVVVTNTSDAARRFTTAFIASGDNGVAASRPSALRSVLPKSTLVLTNVALAGRDGMLEINGAPQLAITARLVAVSPSGRSLGSVQVPAVGSDQAISANGTAEIQGISRPSAGTALRFGLINLGAEPASCTATAVLVNGSAIGGVVQLTAPPRSHTQLAAPGGAFSTSRYTDSRLEVTCNQPFYAYGVQAVPESGRISFLAPSIILHSSQLEAASRTRGDGDDGPGGGQGGGGGGGNGGNGGGPGGNGGGGGGPVAGQDSLSFPGLFLNQRQGEAGRAFDLPLRTGVSYRRITVEFDLYLNQWQSPLFHAVTSLRRSDRTLYYGLILRGDRAKTIIDLGHEQMAKGDGPWRERTQYHIRIETDAGSRTVTFKAFQGGNLVQTVTGGLVSRDLSVPSGRTMSVDFSIGRVADGAYFPTYGWQYSNLSVRAEPY